MNRSIALLAVALPVLSGCISTAASIVTAPVKLASGAVDLATTSQSEADEKRGREIRRREEELGKLQRSYDKHVRQCNDGNEQACYTARSEYGQIQDMLPTVPYEPQR